MCDPNQKTMQALGNLAVLYATLVEAGANLEIENSEGDTLYTDECKAMDELAKARQRQGRLQEELKNSCGNLDTAFIELNNYLDLHDAVCHGLEDVGKKTIDLKRAADDAHDRSRSHRDCCRRATKDHVSAEEELNDSLGRLGQLVKDAEGATHAFSCGVPDRDSNEAHDR